MTGKIGIGTNAPGQLLQVGTTGGSSLQQTVLFGNGGYTTNDLPSTPGNYVSGDKLVLWNDSIGKISIGVGSAYDMILQSSGNSSSAGFRFFTGSSSGSAGSEVLRIAGSGNVGIGTTNPLEKLSVAGGNIRIEDTYSLKAGSLDAVKSNGGYLNVGNTSQNLQLYGGSGYAKLDGFAFRIGQNITPNGNSAYSLGDSSTSWLNLYLSGTASMGGSVGIGTTTPSAKLSITGLATNADLFAISSSTNSRMLTFNSTGQLNWGAGLGAITHIAGPVDQAFSISAGAPLQIATTVAGNNLVLSASNATLGSSSGTAGGGAVSISAGNGINFNASGLGNGGAINLTAGNAAALLNSSYPAGGDGGSISLTAGQAGANNGSTGGSINLTAGRSGVNGSVTGGITLATPDAGQIHGDILLLSGSNPSAAPVSNTGGGAIKLVTGYGNANYADTNGQATKGGLLQFTLGNGGMTTTDAISQIGGTGGLFNLVGGSGGVARSVGGINIGGNGSSLMFTSGAGGSATSTTGTRTGGNSGNIVFNVGAAGTGATANGTLGNFQFLTGNVGIGTTSPVGQLHVYSSNNSVIEQLVLSNPNIGASARSRLSFYGATNSSDATPAIKGFFDYISPSNIQNVGGVALADAFQYSGNSSKTIFWQGGNTPIHFFTNGLPRLIVDGSGNVGIGTINPSATLQVYKNTNSTSDTLFTTTGINGNVFAIDGVGNINLQGNITSLTGASNFYVGSYYKDRAAILTGSMQESDKNKIIISPSGYGAGNNISFTTNSSQRMMIDSSGSLGLGTSTPTAQLTTTGTVRFAGLTGAGSNLIVDSLGNVTVSSDERLKNIDSQFTRGLDAIMQINPITYHWKSSTGYDTLNAYTGFSAQNVQLAIPEAVGTSSSGFLNLADRPIIAALVNAVKELGSAFIKVENGVAYLKDIVVNSITAKEVHTEKLCIDDVCVTKQQMQQLLKNQGITPSSVSTPEVKVVGDNNLAPSGKAASTGTTSSSETRAPASSSEISSTTTSIILPTSTQTPVSTQSSTVTSDLQINIPVTSSTQDSEPNPVTVTEPPSVDSGSTPQL